MKTQTKGRCHWLYSSFLAATTVLAFTGCASDPTARSQGAPQDDRLIVQSVKDSLQSTPNHAYTDVQVASSNGHVQLTGVVQNLWQADNATVIASRIPGTLTVDNYLVIKNGSQPTTAEPAEH